jgi:hypothetical protein
MLAIGTGLLATLIVVLFLFLNRVPHDYPPMDKPLDTPVPGDYARFGLDGAESPYLGHTGSWDGQGGAMFGRSKAADLDKEAAMGLRWTFMPVHWRNLEPKGPVDLNPNTPPAWKELDQFVIEAQRRKLNILMQAPVMGGNAGGPPAWAERRQPGRSAPMNMEAAAAFAAKLAGRYKPGGTLALQQGWAEQFGVRAWELDNEPEMYRTHWQEQAGDYAEFATKVASKIKEIDPQAFILLPAVASGKDALPWIEAALDAHGLRGSPAYRSQGLPYSIGPVADGISFHVYEGMDSAFAGQARTIEPIVAERRAVFEKWEKAASGFHYAPKKEYWHTEGNFDFIGALSSERRAAWRVQFFTRAFAAGVRKVCVMDASEAERIAVRTYVKALPWPFPMNRADALATVKQGQAVVFKHEDASPNGGRVWIIWAIAGGDDAIVEIPVRKESVAVWGVDGSEKLVKCANGRLSLRLQGDPKMSPPSIIVDR